MKAVILAGGGGTRLWPLSTPKLPKQFQKLASDKTMLEETIDRLDFLALSDIYIAINKDHLKLVQKICPKIPKKNIIIEPALRDTASAIGFAATIIEHRHPGEVMITVSADHLIQNKKEYQKMVRKAAQVAEREDTLNIIEVVARGPNTNYGYVRIGKELAKSVYELDKFVEKPSLTTAKKYVKSTKYLWNTGIYVWKASVLLGQYKKHQPRTYKKFAQIAALLGTTKENSAIKKIYPTLEKISIDYAIMEKIDPSLVRIIKADLKWADIGSWKTLWEELASSPTANVTRGPIELTDCKGCLIYADNKKTIKAKGLRDTIIVDTPAGKIAINKKTGKEIKSLL